MNSPDDLPEFSRPKSATGRWVIVLGVTLPMAVGAGIVLGSTLFGGKRTACPPVASAKASAEPAPSSAPPPTLTELATRGDYKALDELKARAPADRSVEETLALARGHAHNKAAALVGFGQEIAKNPGVLDKKDQLARLKEFFDNRETSIEASAIIVALPGTEGPDLLYEAVAAPKNRAEAAALGGDLLETKEVRAKASPALLVTLDLQRAKACEDFKALLPKAAAVGDRRAIPTLAKLTKKKGCGDTLRDDCYECLRPLEKDKDAIDLVDAIKAARRRHPPKY